MPASGSFRRDFSETALPLPTIGNGPLESSPRGTRPDANLLRHGRRSGIGRMVWQRE